MPKLRAILPWLFLALAAVAGRGQQLPALEVTGRDSESVLEYDPRSHCWTATNGVVVRYESAVLTAERGSVNEVTGEVVADGHVRLQRDEMVWAAEHLRYNFQTRQMEAQQFRTGLAPVFVTGQGLHGILSNRVDTATNQIATTKLVGGRVNVPQGVYYATNAVVTTDDSTQPFETVRAKSIKIVPGQYVQARDAVLYLGGVPVFYFPYYSRRLSERANQFLSMPGFRSIYGAYLLNTYTWFLNEQFDGTVHLDYRQRRGLGAGADVNAHLDRWGEAEFQGYYLHDKNPQIDTFGPPPPANRQMVYFNYQAEPFTNLTVKTAVRSQSDADVMKEFFEQLYNQNPEPSTFFDVEKFWQNWSLDAYAQPRVNDFFETVERLPDVTLTGYRQQLGNTPVYYESDSSFGYFHRVFADTNGPVTPDFAAARGDTYHQLTLPQTLMGWLNFTPRVGGRFTYYSQATGPGATTSEEYREVFNTGAELSFKASRIWPAVRSKLFDVNGLRHIFEPSVNYVYVPVPNVPPPMLPQFDYEMASLRLLPIEYPDYNAIDSIDSQNVVRLGMRNKLQTKRADGATNDVDNVVDWDAFTDWRLHPRADQTSFSDVESLLAFKPRSWVTLESETRFDPSARRFNLARETLTVTPNSTWNWGFTYYYLRQDTNNLPTAWGIGSHVLMNTLYYRINENWGLQASHYYDVTLGKLAQQSYYIYRDFRSWTGALVVSLRQPGIGPNDFTVGFSLSLKAHPRFPLGTDVVNKYGLLGY